MRCTDIKQVRKVFFFFFFFFSIFVPDESFVVGEDQTPVGAYLDFKDMVKIAVENNVGKWDFRFSFFPSFSPFSFCFIRVICESCCSFIPSFQDAIHPGYGLLSENVAFARACRDAGVTFIGPSPEVLEIFGDKTQARNLAIECGVPVIPGTTDPCLNVDDARKQIADMGGLPVMLKAVHGGGGR
jgi:pyruvate carboxylase